MMMAQAEEGGICVQNSEGALHPQKMPLFLFFTCKTTGNNFMWHKMLDVAVRCWPYVEDAPVFYRRIEHDDNCQRNRRKGPCKNGHEPKSPDSVVPHAVCVVDDFLHWIDGTVEKAASTTGLELYPVLIAHGGETFQFLFFFRMLERYNIVAMDTVAAHSIHFADPMPILKQYKDAKHTWLVGSRSFGLSSLLNDWFPAEFDEADLMQSRSQGSLVIKLYTQCPLYWLLYRTPIYNTEEWIEFYQSRVCYRKDKWELQENMPSSVFGIQRKLTIKHLLKNGYSWTGLLDLYKTCESSQHFWQELRDIDIKSAISRKITLAVDDLELEQDGSREYKVRIRSNMPHAKYYHLTDARGRRFVLRVANVLPPCIYRLDSLVQDCWQVPESLLRIGRPETWDAVMGWPPDAAERHDCHVDANDTELAAGLKDMPLEDTDSDEDWQDSGVVLLENGELPAEYCRKAQATHVPTTLVTGMKAINPFSSALTGEWIAVDKADETTLDPKPDEKCQSSMSSTSSSQSDTGTAASTNHVAPATSSCAAQTNQKFSKSGKASSSANKRAHARPGKSWWTNQKDRGRSGDLASCPRESHTRACHWMSASTDGRPASHHLTFDPRMSSSYPTNGRPPPPRSPHCTLDQSEDCTRVTRPKSSQSQFSGPVPRMPSSCPTNGGPPPRRSPHCTVDQSENSTRVTRPKTSQSNFSGPVVHGAGHSDTSKGTHSSDRSLKKKKSRKQRKKES